MLLPRLASTLTKHLNIDRAAQANLWTEYIADEETVEYMLLPRLAGKARALLKGRYHVSTEDIRQVAVPVLRHRIVTNFTAEAEGVRPDTIIKRLMEHIPRQQYDDLDAQTAKMLRDQPAA